MLKKSISLTLVALLMLVFLTHPAFAATKEEKFAEKVKTGIAKLKTGEQAKVKLKLKDGTKLEGYITESNENCFVVRNTKTNKAVSVDYAQVKQVNGNNLNEGVVILVGIAIAILFIIFPASHLR